MEETCYCMIITIKTFWFCCSHIMWTAEHGTMKDQTDFSSRLKRQKLVSKMSNLCCSVITDHHTDGRQTPASPVHQVEEEETCHRDEVSFWNGRKKKLLPTIPTKRTKVGWKSLWVWMVKEVCSFLLCGWPQMVHPFTLHSSCDSQSQRRTKTPRRLGTLWCYGSFFLSFLKLTPGREKPNWRQLLCSLLERAANFPELHYKPTENSSS